MQNTGWRWTRSHTVRPGGGKGTNQEGTVRTLSLGSGGKKDPFMRESFSVFREEQRTSKTCASAELLVLADHTL